MLPSLLRAESARQLASFGGEATALSFAGVIELLFGWALLLWHCGAKLPRLVSVVNAGKQCPFQKERGAPNHRSAVPGFGSRKVTGYSTLAAALFCGFGICSPVFITTGRH
jgi:hypothetical protein